MCDSTVLMSTIQYRAVCFPVCLSARPSVCMSPSLSLSLSLALPVCLSARPSVRLPVRLSARLIICPHVRPSVRPAARQSVRPQRPRVCVAASDSPITGCGLVVGSELLLVSGNSNSNSDSGSDRGSDSDRDNNSPNKRSEEGFLLTFNRIAPGFQDFSSSDRANLKLRVPNIAPGFQDCSSSGYLSLGT